MRKRHIGLYVALSTTLLILTFAAGPAGGADYYVSPAGSISNSGTEGSPWRTINHGVSQASAGDTIWVMDDDIVATDDYTEEVLVNKSLTIQAYDSDGTHPRIKSPNTLRAVILVEADNVTLRGLDVYGATGSYGVGIQVSRYVGISANPVYNVVIEDCRAGWDASHYNRAGIYLRRLNGGRVSGCTASYNEHSGILVQPTPSDSSNLEILNNTTSHNNNYGIYLDYSANGNTVRGNTAESNHLDCLYLYNSDDNVIEDNVFGLSELKSGIRLSNESDGNTFKGNTSTGNWENGIELANSDNNRFYRNELQGDLGAVDSSTSTGNIWASPTAERYLYEGATYTSVLGNYYDDYIGSDVDGDGIGDTAHDFVAPETQDDNPLMEPLANYGFDIVSVFVDGFESGNTNAWSDAVGMVP